LSAACLSAVGSARAQTLENRVPSDEDRNRSHAQIDFEGVDFNQALRERFQSLRQKSEAKDTGSDAKDQWMKNAKEMTARYLKNREDPKIKEMAKQLLQDPNAREWLQQELDARRKAIPREQFKGLEETLKKYQEEMRNTAPSGSPAAAGRSQHGLVNVDPLEQPGGPNAKENTPNRQPMGMQSGSVSTNQPREPSQPNDLSQPRQPTAQQKLTRWVQKALDVKNGPLADSQAIQEAVHELRRARSSPEAAATNDNGWLGQVSRFSQSLTNNDFWSKVNWPKLGKWQPSISSRDLPHVRSPLGSSSFEGMPSMPSATAINWGLQFLWIALIVAAGVLVWKLLGGYGAASRRTGWRGWSLGPWPVSPDAVGTRQDVVQAFEYLSLLKLGPAAQSRNHVLLAAELGEPAPEHQGAAQRLATIYEKARYTPADEALSDAALASARRELCYLAGIK
jgi:hypothetical protein